MHVKRVLGTVFWMMGLLLLACVSAEAQLAQDEKEWVGPGITMINCGSRHLSLASAKMYEGGMSSIGWAQGPPGENSGKKPISTNGTFYFYIKIEDSDWRGRPALLPRTRVEIPGLQHKTKQVCINTLRPFVLQELSDGTYWDLDKGDKVGEPDWSSNNCSSSESDIWQCYGGSVPKNCDGEGYAMATFYEVNAADYSNGGSLGVLCPSNDYKCEIIEAGPENSVPLEYRSSACSSEIKAMPVFDDFMAQNDMLEIEEEEGLNVESYSVRSEVGSMP